MAVLVIGNTASNRSSTTGNYPPQTLLDTSGAATQTGYLDTIKIWVSVVTYPSIKAGTWYGSAGTWTLRDYEILGQVLPGAERTFTGLNIDVAPADIIGYYGNPGNPNNMECDSTAGYTIKYLAGDQFSSGAKGFSTTSNKGPMSLYGSGYTYELPTITTSAATGTTKTTSTGKGNVSHDGGSPCTERGICFCLRSHGDPDINDFKQIEAVPGNEGDITAYLSNLIPGTYYNLRAYATNVVGTAYGETVELSTLIAATYWEVMTADRVLSLDNTTAFTPDADYEPATKKYVDDFKSVMDGGSAAPGTTAALVIDQGGVIPAEQIESLDAGLVADPNKTEVYHDLGAPTVDAWDDLVITLANVKAPAASSPTWTAYKGSEVPAFAKNATNVLYFGAQLPHAYKLGSDIEFHIHLAYPDATAGNSIWYFTYSWADMSSNLPAESNSGNVIIAAPGVGDRHQYAEMIATISGAGKGISSVLLCSLSRLGGDGADDYDNDIYAISADFHYQRDTNGSRLQTTK